MIDPHDNISILDVRKNHFFFLSILWCNQSSDYSIGRCGYKLGMNNKSLIILLCFGLLIETKCRNLVIFACFCLPIVIKSLKNLCFLKFGFNFCSWQSFVNWKKRDVINIGWSPNRWFGWRCSKYFVYEFTLYNRWITSQSMFLFGKLLPNGDFVFFKMEEKGCWVFSGKISHFLKKKNLDSILSSRS